MVEHADIAPRPAAWPRVRLMLCAVLLAVLALLAGLGVEGRALPGLGHFIGRFHVVLLHFPIGLLLLALVLQVGRIPLIGLLLPQANAGVVTFVLGLGALSAWAAAVCGWLLTVGGGYAAASIAPHFYGGTVTAAGALLAFMCHLVGQVRPSFRVKALGFGLLMFTNLALLVTGHLGGVITHGETYLTEHAPAWIRRVLGSADRRREAPPASGNPLDRPVFQTAILPFLEAKCVECHNEQKIKGKLRLDTYADMMKGGSSGPSVVPGQPAESELLRRMALPEDDDDHMPPAGKPQPTADEIAVLTWWIEAGAAEQATARTLSPPESIRTLLAPP